MTVLDAVTDDASADRLTPDLLKLAGVVILGTFAAQMDATMVNIALDTFRRDFHTTVATIQWIMTGYLLTMTVMIPLTGWMVDRVGAKTAWLSSLTAFLVGSLLCGVAWSAGSLIMFRIIQGVGGGLLLPLSQAILAQAAGERRLGRLMAMVGVPALLGPVIGPVVGGVVVDDLSWRWIFFINVPITLLALWLSGRVMLRATGSGAARLDLLGLVLLSPALALIVYGLSQAGNHGSFHGRSVVIPMVISAALLFTFVIRTLRTRVEPIIELRLLRVRSFAAASATVFLVTMTMIGAMLLLPLYYQQVRGESVLHTGLLLTPQGVGAAIAIAVCGGLADRFSARPIAVVGVLLSAAGTLALTQVGAATSTLFISGALVLRGAGFGAVAVPAFAAAYYGLRQQAIPRATSSLRIFQQLGGSFGVAVLAVILQRQITDAIHAAPRGGIDVSALAGAFASTYWWAFAFSALALVPALLLSGRANRPTEADQAGSQSVG